MHVAEQGHAGHRAKQHAHQHRNERQQHPPAAERQQQQQEYAQGGATPDPGHLLGGLLLASCRIQQPTGREQLHVSPGRCFAAVYEQIGHLQWQVHIEGVAGGARPQQYPALAVGIGDQCPAADVQLHRALLRLAVLDTSGQAQPVLLAGHQAEAAEGIEQCLDPLLDECVGMLDQQLPVSRR
ncbi:hypothetical protein D3C78_982430 [compost metagenome]